MKDWNLIPARDHATAGIDRYRTAERESGLVASTVRLSWWIVLRAALRAWHGVRVHGRERLPPRAPMILISNHTSHLDTLLLTTLLPLAWRDRTYPVAAADVFYGKLTLAAFSAVVINSLALVRGKDGRQALATIRERIARDRCVVILFPEGTRSRTGVMGTFKNGIGMLAAATDIPVVPCFLRGAYDAMPPERRFPRRSPIEIYVGEPQTFAALANDRDGWTACATALEQAVRALDPARQGSSSPEG